MKPVKAIDLVFKAQPMIATLRQIIAQNCDESKMRVFIDDAAIISDGTVMLRWVISGMVFCAVVLLHTCLFQAIGKARQALALSLSRQGVIYLAVFIIATAAAEYTGFLAAQLIADIISTVLALILYVKTVSRLSAET